MSKPLTYKQFLQKFDEMHEWKPIGNEGKNPLQELSAFSFEYPKIYNSYRERMMEEQNGEFMHHNETTNGEVWD